MKQQVVSVFPFEREIPSTRVAVALGDKAVVAHDLRLWCLSGKAALLWELDLSSASELVKDALKKPFSRVLKGKPFVRNMFPHSASSVFLAVAPSVASGSDLGLIISDKGELLYEQRLGFSISAAQGDFVGGSCGRVSQLPPAPYSTALTTVVETRGSPVTAVAPGGAAGTPCLLLVGSLSGSVSVPGGGSVNLRAGPIAALVQVPDFLSDRGSLLALALSFPLPAFEADVRPAVALLSIEGDGPRATPKILQRLPVNGIDSGARLAGAPRCSVKSGLRGRSIHCLFPAVSGDGARTQLIEVRFALDEETPTVQAAAPGSSVSLLAGSNIPRGTNVSLVAIKGTEGSEFVDKMVPLGGLKGFKCLPTPLRALLAASDPPRRVSHTAASVAYLSAGSIGYARVGGPAHEAGDILTDSDQPFLVSFNAASVLTDAGVLRSDWRETVFSAASALGEDAWTDLFPMLSSDSPEGGAGDHSANASKSIAYALPPRPVLMSCIRSPPLLLSFLYRVCTDTLYTNMRPLLSLFETLRVELSTAIRLKADGSAGLDPEEEHTLFTQLADLAANVAYVFELLKGREGAVLSILEREQRVIFRVAAGLRSRAALTLLRALKPAVKRELGLMELKAVSRPKVPNEVPILDCEPLPALLPGPVFQPCELPPFFEAFGLAEMNPQELPLRFEDFPPEALYTALLYMVVFNTSAPNTEPNLRFALEIARLFGFPPETVLFAAMLFAVDFQLPLTFVDYTTPTLAAAPSGTAPPIIWAAEIAVRLIASGQLSDAARFVTADPADRSALGPAVLEDRALLCASGVPLISEGSIGLFSERGGGGDDNARGPGARPKTHRTLLSPTQAWVQVLLRTRNVVAATRAVLDLLSLAQTQRKENDPVEAKRRNDAENMNEAPSERPAASGLFPQTPVVGWSGIQEPSTGEPTASDLRPLIAETKKAAFTLFATILGDEKLPAEFGPAERKWLFCRREPAFRSLLCSFCLARPHLLPLVPYFELMNEDAFRAAEVFAAITAGCEYDAETERRLDKVGALINLHQRVLPDLPPHLLGLRGFDTAPTSHVPEFLEDIPPATPARRTPMATPVQRPKVRFPALPEQTPRPSPLHLSHFATSPGFAQPPPSTQRLRSSVRFATDAYIPATTPVPATARHSDRIPASIRLGLSNSASVGTPGLPGMTPLLDGLGYSGASASPDLEPLSLSSTPSRQ
eukprot:gnl/Chilomastix_cuspidata/2035.p1 GENE.gnl/Chilomastix_cuspidata/2035~~gnl/Chilomastix_cuspidata/2035.p1  ORF type:complete len:1208 (+),score=164.61 gnl/Chilomastix_cuspidata/2035:58-3681(+)